MVTVLWHTDDLIFPQRIAKRTTHSPDLASSDYGVNNG